MDDQGEGAARLHHVVHDLRDAGLVRPVEGLPEGDQPIRSRRRRRKLLGAGLNPADVPDAAFFGGSAPLREHRGVGVEPDRLLEHPGQPDGEAPRTAAAVQEPPGPVEAQLLRENSLELRGVRRSPPEVMGSGALVDRGVVGHGTTMVRARPGGQPGSRTRTYRNAEPSGRDLAHAPREVAPSGDGLEERLAELADLSPSVRTCRVEMTGDQTLAHDQPVGGGLGALRVLG